MYIKNYDKKSIKNMKHSWNAQRLESEKNEG